MPPTLEQRWVFDPSSSILVCLKKIHLLTMLLRAASGGGQDRAHRAEPGFLEELPVTWSLRLNRVVVLGQLETNG